MTFFVQAMWQVLLDLAPFLLLGAAVAGLLHVALPKGFVHRQFTGRGGVLKAVLLGVPLPLCSCGVIPAGLGLRKDGASRGATVGFLISTPQTGVDSILVSASFLGWPFALFKVGAAAVTGFAGGWLAEWTSDGKDAASSGTPVEQGTRRRSLRETLDYGLEILRTIWHWIVFGIVASALISTLVPQGSLATIAGDGRVLPVLLALVVSLPLYVCATASVPIAAALVAGGFPPGAALVFLMAGPATNLATVGAIRRFLGGRTLAAYLVAIIGGSVGLGIAFDFLLEASPSIAAHAHGNAAWWKVTSAIVLLLMLAWFAFDDLRLRLARSTPAGSSSLEGTEIGVSGMTCDSCVNKLESALRSEPGVEGARVLLDPGKAIVYGTVGRKRLHQIVVDAGYSPT